MKRLSLSPLEKAAALLLCAALAFSFLVARPLEERSKLLLSRIHPQAASGTDAKVAAVHRFLKKEEAPTDWLAKLYGIGRATGIELQSASYAAQEAGGRIEHYQIVLPVSGSYSQLRDFLKRAGAEIPVLSVDQITIRRESRNEAALQAELRLTLHMVRS
jgi:hypothetical protein